MIGECIWEWMGGHCSRETGSNARCINSAGKSLSPGFVGELSTCSQTKTQGRIYPTWLDSLSVPWFLLRSFIPHSLHWTGREEGEGGKPQTNSSAIWRGIQGIDRNLIIQMLHSPLVLGFRMDNLSGLYFTPHCSVFSPPGIKLKHSFQFHRKGEFPPPKKNSPFYIRFWFFLIHSHRRESRERK